VTIETAASGRAGAEAGAGPGTETCDLCGAVIQPEPGESRFEAVVAHFEATHIDGY
jgi:hypothetical protein